jgi:hypothetical protein
VNPTSLETDRSPSREPAPSIVPDCRRADLHRDWRELRRRPIARRRPSRVDRFRVPWRPHPIATVAATDASAPLAGEAVPELPG